MCQNADQAITKYVASLKAKALLSEFHIVCTEYEPDMIVSYAEELVSQRLAAGLIRMKE